LSTFAGCSWWPANDENAKKVVPEFEGLEEFGGDIVMHACDYKIQIQREL
jgi:indole-3-pyruvate monooxygenase